MADDSLITPETRALVGKEIAFAGSEEIEKGMIRRFALATGDLNPLYHDEEYARKSRYGGIIAPPTFIFEINFSTGAELREDGSPVARLRPPPPLNTLVRGGNEYEFFRPVRAGDVISGRYRIVDIYQKRGRTGDLVFAIGEATFSNLKGEALGVNRETMIFLP